MKILNAQQIRDWDATTMRRQHIPSLTLMERAAVACVDWIVARYPAKTPFIVMCGTGNNGGDGLAITRLLLEKGYAAAAFLVKHSDRLSDDCTANLVAVQSAGPAACTVLEAGQFITSLPPEAVLIDALFGTGLNRALEAYVAECISRLNALPNKKVAIDLPSGLRTDTLPAPSDKVLQAHHTLTFQQVKRTMLHPEGGRYCGRIHRIDIGLDSYFLKQTSGHWHTLEKQMVQEIFQPRPRFSNKGNFGTALLVAGSRGMMGAAVLAVRAAGRAGAGKVCGLIPECGYEILQSSAPEAMCRIGGADEIEKIEGWESSQGIGIGPGLGRHPTTAGALHAFLKKLNRPIVIDADALNVLSENKSWLGLVPCGSILTPHPKEWERLFGPSNDSMTRAEQVRSLAMQHQWILIAKDAYSIVALPDGNCFYVMDGSEGMATGGSGDVLTGILTGLLAQGYAPEKAALLGSWIHAVAGSRAAQWQGVEAMLAGDIIAQIGAAFSTLNESHS